MRLFPAVKTDTLRAGRIHGVLPAAGVLLAVLLCAAPSFAQNEESTATTTTPYPAPGSATTMPVTPPVDRASFLQGLQAAMQVPATNPLTLQSDQDKEKARIQALGSAKDPNSPLYKANKLADEAQTQRDGSKALAKGAADSTGIDDVPPPPEIEALQQINTARAGMSPDIVDDPINKEIALDMRRDAQKEAALSYGARGGLAKRNYQIMERMKGFDTVLDKVFNFRALLIKTASGLLIEPPIVKESIDALVIDASGDEAAVADKVFDINKKAKIVSAPRDWRQYLIQTWSDVPPPPHVLWPKNKQEQADWSTWVAQGWEAGSEQAEQIFESNVNRLVAEYNGMVRYRMLLAQGMISAPYAMHEDRGVTGDKNQMRVGDRAVRITGPSQFLTGAELWKPADR
jgi:defect-in-organelle-trafficking protein DotC